MKRRELIKGVLGLSAIAATGIKADDRFQGKRRVVNKNLLADVKAAFQEAHSGDTGPVTDWEPIFTGNSSDG